MDVDVVSHLSGDIEGKSGSLFVDYELFLSDELKYSHNFFDIKCFDFELCLQVADIEYSNTNYI